jgi:hypothetical protein
VKNRVRVLWKANKAICLSLLICHPEHIKLYFHERSGLYYLILEEPFVKVAQNFSYYT